MAPLFQQPFMSGGFPSMNRAAAGPVGGWVELGRTTLGGTGSSIDVSSLSDKRYYMVLTNIIMNSSGGGGFRVGNSSIDTGTNYANRYSINGAADGTATSYTLVEDSPTSFSGNQSNVIYIANYSSKEKLFINQQARNNAAGAANAPTRFEAVAKWTNTSNPIDIMRYYAQAGDFASGSEVVVLGWDPADSHSNNFWEELYSGSGDAGMDTGASAFTAKKYLWIQMYLNDMISGANVNMVLNGVESSNYALRYSQNGGADGTINTRSDNLIHLGASNETEAFINIFIINDGSNEKLGIVHNMTQQTAGATTAPARQELVFKDSQTTQITDVEVRRTSGSWGANSQLKIWGAN